MSVNTLMDRHLLHTEPAACHDLLCSNCAVIFCPHAEQVDFLYDLMRLDEDSASDSNSPSRPAHELPERRAAKGLFRWEVRYTRRCW